MPVNPKISTMKCSIQVLCRRFISRRFISQMYP
jgi:hypothetical protein